MSTIILFMIIILLLLERRRLKVKYKITQKIVNNLEDSICFKNNKGEILEASKGFFDLFGLNSSDIGKTQEELKTISSNKKLIEEYLTTKELEESEKSNFSTVIRENNERKYYNVEKILVNDSNNKFLGTIIVAKDITSQRKAEVLHSYAKQREENMSKVKNYAKVKMDFFANLSHEFRTPLNVVLSALRMKELYAKNEELDEKERTKRQIYYNGVIRQNILRLIKLTNNIIDTTKYEVGELNCNLANANIVEFIENITMSVMSIMEDKQLELIFDTNTEECIIAFDFEKMERVILNLLSNSVKFTKKGGKILVEIEENIGTIDIYIKDTGCGIPEDMFEFVFEKFFQVDKSINRNREGSGIGLNIVKSFVNIQSGTIELLESTKRGTTFKIVMPKTLVENNKDEKNMTMNDNEEKINIEFSDIYD